MKKFNLQYLIVVFGLLIFNKLSFGCLPFNDEYIQEDVAKREKIIQENLEKEKQVQKILIKKALDRKNNKNLGDQKEEFDDFEFLVP